MYKSNNEHDIAALKVAKATQKPGQTKEQTKLIAQGIEKGIAEYKKREKQKARERDKQRKAQLKQKQAEAESSLAVTIEKPSSQNIYKVSLVLSWLGFIVYILIREILNV